MPFMLNHEGTENFGTEQGTSDENYISYFIVLENKTVLQRLK